LMQGEMIHKIVAGKCHMCSRIRVDVFFCAKCGHWLCAQCSKRYIDRAIEALKILLGKVRPDCCGVILDNDVFIPGPPPNFKKEGKR